MYFTRIKIIGKGDVREKIRQFLSSLGYILDSEKPNLYVVVGNIEKALKYGDKKAGLIFVTGDGEYVIPLKGESKGVSFIASIISDMLEANLISTSKFSQEGLYSLEEFSWVNALYTTNKNKLKEVNKKLIEKKRLYVYSNGTSLYLPDGYVRVQAPCEADVVIGEGDCNSFVLKPMKVIVGLHYIEKIPAEVLLYSVKLTLKSLYINENRVDVIITPIKDNTASAISKILNATHVVIQGESCEDMLYNYGGRILLRGVRRSYGVSTCLSVLHI